MNDTIFAHFYEPIDELFYVFEGEEFIHTVGIIFNQSFEGAIIS